MEAARLAAALTDALDKLGVPLRIEPLPEGSLGGLVRLRGSPIVLLSQQATVTERCAILAGALAQLDTSSLFLSPFVRAVLERYGRT